MEQHPPLHLGVVAIEKGTFGSPSTKVGNNKLVWWKLLTKKKTKRYIIAYLRIKIHEILVVVLIILIFIA